MTQLQSGIKHRVLALVSGGKDSCFSMLQCVAAGHEIVGLANLKPKDENEKELDSYMYQTVGHQAIDMYADAMRLPLFRGTISKGESLNTDATYTLTENDEVEALYDLLVRIKGEKGENFFTAVCSGAILSDYQRVRVEHVCTRLKIVSLSYLWRRDQAELLDEMINDGRLNSVLVKVATLGLDQSHLGKSLGEVRDHLHEMHKKYGINICGEGGEYETFTLDCPLFFKSIVIKDSSVLIHSADAFAPVALLGFNSLTLQDKQELESKKFLSQMEMLKFQNINIKTPLDYCANEICDTQVDILMPQKENFVRLAPILAALTCDSEETIDLIIDAFQGMKESTGWFAISNLTSCHFNPTEATKTIFDALKAILLSIDCSIEDDLVSVMVIVSDMQQYAEINKEYVGHFGLNPPVRVCIQADIDVPLTVSVVGYKSNDNKDNVDQNPRMNYQISRQVMHVQSVSHWAAANIGPYSQAVEIDGILHIAGLIGLIAGSMELVSGVKNQAMLSLRHLKRILKVHGEKSLANVAQIICYVTNESFSSTVMKTWIEQVENEYNLSGVTINIQTTDGNMTMCDHLKRLLKIVVVPNLPKNALVEWHVLAIENPIITATRDGNNAEENLILSTDEKGRVFFVGSTKHLGWEEKWDKEQSSVKEFFTTSFINKPMPTRGHMQVYGKKFFINTDKSNNLGKLSLPCGDNYIQILPSLVPVISFGNEDTSYVVNGLLY